MMFGFSPELQQILGGAKNRPFPGTGFDPTANLNLAGLLGGGQYGASRFISPNTPNVMSPTSMTGINRGGAANFASGLLDPSYFGKQARAEALPMQPNQPPVMGGKPMAPPGYVPGTIF